MDALGEPMRRRIFEQLRRGPAAVGELAAGLPVSRPAVSQHLRVLKSAGLVRDRKAGTRRLYEVDPDALGELRDWFDDFWSEALARYQLHASQSDAAAQTAAFRDLRVTDPRERNRDLRSKQSRAEAERKGRRA
jgi:DNA-binding transcriptional ArsR family regulator